MIVTVGPFGFVAPHRASGLTAPPPHGQQRALSTGKDWVHKHISLFATPAT
jgi:hypothetical protein